MNDATYFKSCVTLSYLKVRNFAIGKLVHKKSIKMKPILLLIITVVILLFYPKANFGQAPVLGTCSGFALFTANGAFSNVGVATIVTGDIGTNVGAFDFTGGTLINGNIYLPSDPVAIQAAIDVANAYSNFSTGGIVLGTPLEIPGILTPGVYSTGGAAALDGDLTLNGGGDPNALFVININGALTIGAAITSHIILTNLASLCNVYWQINGDFTLGAGSIFRGTIVSSGAIHLMEGSSLEGRGLTTAGAIDLHNSAVNFLPVAGTVTGTALVCQGQTGVIYSVPALNNATSYIWTLPVGATITAGVNTNNITVDFNLTALSGNINVYGTNACGNGIVSPNFVLTVLPLPLTSAIYHQ